MIQPISSTVNADGHLVIGGCDSVELAKQYGTPLYVLDIDTIRDRVHQYQSIQAKYPHVRIAYASKALSLTALYEWLAKEGLYFDVVSDGELFTLRHAGVPASRAYFHGNNKTFDELRYALKEGIGCIVVDNEAELDRIGVVHKELGLIRPVDILIRVVPELEAHTHEFIRTGQRDTKFGVHMELLPALVEGIKKRPYLHLKGLHAHIGSQIFDLTPYDVLIERLMDLSMSLYQSYGVVMEEMSVGGGIGIPYTADDHLPDIQSFMEDIASAMTNYVRKINYPINPVLVLEPGRSLIANAGVTLYSVGGVKAIPAGRTFVSVDGGMADNPRPITYDAPYSADIANKMNKAKAHVYTVSGKFCESGDILIQEASLPEVEVADTLVVYATGAYNYSMSSNYNRFRKPAMVMVEKGHSTLVLKRETLEDIIRNDAHLD